MYRYGTRGFYIMSATSSLQNAIEIVEQLSPDEQAQLSETIQRRLVEQRRDDLALSVAAGRRAYGAGEVRRGSVEDLLANLEATL